MCPWIAELEDVHFSKMAATIIQSNIKVACLNMVIKPNLSFSKKLVISKHYFQHMVLSKTHAATTHKFYFRFISAHMRRANQ